MFDTEGVSYIAMVNSTATLSDIKSISSGISGGDLTVDSLEYEWEDSEYKWNTNRNLKAREPFLSSGNYYEDNFGTLKAVVKKVLDNAYSNLHKLSIDDAFIQKAHKLGIEAAYPALFAMDYK